jgi:hypothetical protein
MGKQRTFVILFVVGSFVGRGIISRSRRISTRDLALGRVRSWFRHRRTILVQWIHRRTTSQGTLLRGLAGSTIVVRQERANSLTRSRVLRNAAANRTINKEMIFGATQETRMPWKRSHEKSVSLVIGQGAIRKRGDIDRPNQRRRRGERRLGRSLTKLSGRQSLPCSTGTTTTSQFGWLVSDEVRASKLNCKFLKGSM